MLLFDTNIVLYIGVQNLLTIF